MPRGSSQHRGWLYDPQDGILAAVYTGVETGAVALAANTATTGILLGTPVTPALALDSIVISNLVASGDILLAANSGGNSQAWLRIDSSAGTMDIFGAGTLTAVFSATILEVQDGIVLALGNDDDAAMVLRTTTLAANTALTNVLAGTPVSAATPANSLLISNITSDGDIAFFCVGGSGANSLEYLRIDASANEVVFNEASANIAFRFETDANANAFVIGTDNSLGFGGSASANAAAIFSNTTTRAAATSVGVQTHMPAQTQNFNNASSTLAIGASWFFGIPTWSGNNATLTFTDSATLFISGIPVASTNVALTNVGSALWIDAGQLRLDGQLDMGFWADSTQVAATGTGFAHVVGADTQNFSNASSTIAIGAVVSLGVATLTGDNATLTFTDAATLYIGGIPAASTNVAITNTALALWVDVGTTRLDGVLTSPSGAIQRWGGTAAHATAAGTNIISLYTGTAPTGTIASGGTMYVATATNVELNYIDSAGNAQQLSTT